MKFMSFNTEHCNSYIKKKIDFQMIADTIKTCEADVVGLNEMRSQGEKAGYDDQTAILSDLTGLKHYYFAEAIKFDGDNPYGNSLLSKHPIISAETVPVPDPAPKMGTNYYETRCLLKATLEGGITVLVTHFGLNPDEQENAVKTVLANLESEKCILMGDFNVTPDSAILKPIYEHMQDTAASIGRPLLSWPSDKPERKIDYIFVSPDIEVVEADVPAIVASDHRPHTAILNI